MTSTAPRRALDPALVAESITLVLWASAEQHADRDPTGVALCVLAAAAYAVSLVLQKPLMAGLSAVQVTWSAGTVGLVACLPFAGRLARQWQVASGSDRLALVYLGLFPTAIAFTTYASALRHMDTGRLSVTTYLVPPITVLLSALLLSETPPLVAYGGGALALLGVAVARRRPAAAIDESVVHSTGEEQSPPAHSLGGPVDQKSFPHKGFRPGNCRTPIVVFLL